MPATIIDDPVTCDECRDQVTDPVRVEDRLVCDECARDYPICDECERVVSSTFETVESNYVCTQCRERYYRECGLCERLTVSRTHATDGRAICQPCEDRYYWTCASCGNVIPDADYCQCDNCCDCSDCCGCDDDEDCDDCEYIHDYGYKPRPEFHGTGPLYLGFELEISTPYRALYDCAALAVDRLHRLGYLKEDSSIVGSGFELVTHPMSYGWALRDFPWSLLSELHTAGCTGDGNGLHVHISRAAFASPAHIYRWMKLFYRNQSRVITLARRRSSYYAEFTQSARASIKHYAKGDAGRRMNAINTCPEDTFELRIFASSLDQQHVQAALALASASVEYTRALTVRDIASRGGWDWSTFAQWVNERPAYAPLSREMERLSCAC